MQDLRHSDMYPDNRYESCIIDNQNVPNMTCMEGSRDQIQYDSKLGSYIIFDIQDTPMHQQHEAYLAILAVTLISVLYMRTKQGIIVDKTVFCQRTLPHYIWIYSKNDASCRI